MAQAQAQQKIVLNETQAALLKSVVKASKLDTKPLDKRTIKALEKRNLVKVTSNKTGSFIIPTAFGKKALA